MAFSKTCVKRPVKKRPKLGFQDKLSLNAGQKYCRMLQGEHSAILLTYIKQPSIIKIFVLFIFEWPFNTGFKRTDVSSEARALHFCAFIFIHTLCM